MTVKIEIDMDRKCRKCGKPGACGNGYCLACTTKYILPGIVKKERDRLNERVNSFE